MFIPKIQALFDMVKNIKKVFHNVVSYAPPNKDLNCSPEIQCQILFSNY